MPTSISWTNSTWNPVTGCEKVSQGCKNCYAEGIASRFFAKQYPPNPDGSPRMFTDVRCHYERLDQPLRWRQPRMVFVNSMSDLFHEDVPDSFLLAVFTVMANTHIATGNHESHIFQILTKRPKRMESFVSRLRWSRGLAVVDIGERGYVLNYMPHLEDSDWKSLGGGSKAPEWLENFSPSNVWLGVSVENQKAADERIPHLLNTPAAVRFLSVEPMLEAVDLDSESAEHVHALGCGESDHRVLSMCRGVDWVICGGESGPGARPFQVEWAYSLLGQCKAAGVPFFMKQLGSWSRGKNRKGENPAEWPEALRVREFPQVDHAGR